MTVCTPPPHNSADFVYCSCGECGECLQDMQTAAAIIGDRQRAITELEGAEECAELHLPRYCSDCASNISDYWGSC